MELRVLQYFLAVAREQTISGAAESLHLTQPTLSRQLKELEDELGKQLMVRGNRRVTLTEDGMLLRKRAEEIVDLVSKTEQEIAASDDIIAGDINIGTGETDAVRVIARVAKILQCQYPDIHIHIISGDGLDIMERLDKGLFDFGILLGQCDLGKYDSLKIPAADVWGVIMRRDSPLADKEFISPEDLWDKPLIVSRQAIRKNDFVKWLKTDVSRLNIVATYNLVYNASLMVDEGMGYALSLDKLINTSGDSNLCFRPMSPRLELDINVVWKKYQVFSKASTKFLQYLQEYIDASAQGQ